MFNVNKLTMIYGDRVLFQDINLHFDKHKRYGLVGANGAGKTTFLKILSGSISPTQGIVQIPNDSKLGILEQDYSKYEEISILDLVVMGNKEIWDAMNKKNILLSKTSMNSTEMESLSKLESYISLHGGYRAEANAAQILSGLGIGLNRQKMPLRTLSSGYKLRVLLSKVLFAQPDLLLLDEPTNYLDIFSIQWLENYLLDYPGSLILSSHDRCFLRQVCQEIIDIDYCEMRRYRGNFDQFLEKKMIEKEIKEAKIASYAKQKKDIAKFIIRFKAKASKARQANSKTRMIEKLKEEEKEYEQLPSSRKYPHFQFKVTRPSGHRVLRVTNISKSFQNDHVLKGISIEVKREEKVAFVGANGVGKSTLLEILTGNIGADKGLIQWGLNVKWSYFPQNFQKLLNPDISIYEWMREISKDSSDQQVRCTLGQMLFDENAQHKKGRALSGGESARLVFGSLMLQDHNVLILDEPTNHLDMEGTDALLEALQDYSGTLIIVSHNRYFISKLANRIIEIKNEDILDFLGGYTEFVEIHKRDYFDANKNVSKTKGKKVHTDLKRERNRKKRDIERLERDITKVEKRLEQVYGFLAAPDFYEKTSKDQKKKVLNEQDNLEKIRESLYKKWEETES